MLVNKNNSPLEGMSAAKSAESLLGNKPKLFGLSQTCKITPRLLAYTLLFMALLALGKNIRSPSKPDRTRLLLLAAVSLTVKTVDIYGKYPRNVSRS